MLVYVFGARYQWRFVYLLLGVQLNKTKFLSFGTYILVVVDGQSAHNKLYC